MPGRFADWAYFQTGAFALAPQVWVKAPSRVMSPAAAIVNAPELVIVTTPVFVVVTPALIVNAANNKMINNFFTNMMPSFYNVGIGTTFGLFTGCIVLLITLSVLVSL